MKNIDANMLNGLAEHITRLYKTLNSKRAGQLEDINTVKGYIYNTSNSFYSKHQSGGHFKLPDIYEQAQTLKAHILESLSSHPEGLFDVFPADMKYSQNAQKQKTMLVCALENMKMTDKLDSIVNDMVECGESIAFIGWKKISKKVRRAVASNGEIAFATVDKPVYEGPVLKRIAPEDFVFDTGGDFEAAAKILRAKRTVDEVFEDRNNSLLTAEIKEQLAAGSGIQADEPVKKLNILEYWGDIRLENGETLKNQLIVIAENRFVIRFEDNPYLNCPFIYANIIENPYTKRGTSPLLAAIDLNKAANDILNTQLTAYSLVVNPPYLAPKGAFKGEQRVKPGKIIEYDSALLPQMPTPLNFSGALCGWDFIKYFKSSIESTTGIFKTMSGQIEAQNRTATELNLTANGQSARLNLILDVINRKIILPIVEKTADILANFKLGTENLLYRAGKELRMLQITDDVRFGDYIYRYSDRKASIERKNRERELVKLLTGFANVPAVAPKINWDECFKLALGELGVENVRLYLNEGVSSVENG